MRTTISLDDNLGKAARRHARQEGLSLSALVARALRTLLADLGGYERYFLQKKLDEITRNENLKKNG